MAVVKCTQFSEAEDLILLEQYEVCHRQLKKKFMGAGGGRAEKKDLWEDLTKHLNSYIDFCTFVFIFFRKIAIG